MGLGSVSDICIIMWIPEIACNTSTAQFFLDIMDLALKWTQHS